MHEILQHIMVLILPLIISNMLHMLVVKYKVLEGLNFPINLRAFGLNKTWRGFFFLTFCNAFVLYLGNKILGLNIEHAFLLGLMLGITYILFELPNSFIKRRLGIASGSKHHQYPFAFSLIDKMDSAFGVCLVYWILGYTDLNMAIYLFILSFLTHSVFSSLLKELHIKKSF